MTDAALDAIIQNIEDARSEFHAATSPYAKVKPFPPGPRTHWGKGDSFLDAAVIGVEGLRPPPPPPSNTLLGVYTGARNYAGHWNFEGWLGSPVPLAVDWHDSATWGGLEGGWSLGAWGGYRVVLDIAGWADGVGGTLAKGAAGAFTGHWTQLAQSLKSQGRSDTIIRLMWEFGGNWYPWSVKSATDAANFATYWRLIVDEMRAVAPELRFDLNSVTGPAINPALSYPGDDYVDYIGFDLYDTKWGSQGTPAERFAFERTRQYGIDYFIGMAAAHGKPLSCPEWGLLHAADQGGRGGGDNPYFVDAMADLFRAEGFGYHAYFNFNAPDGRHHLDLFPQSKARYLARFGA